MAPPRSLTELNDDLTAEILIHVGPDEPSRLFQISLTCKRWHRIISDPGFHRRYSAFHRWPPRLLGFFYNVDFPGAFSRFVPATPTAFRLPVDRFNDRHVSWALDCRHGRVLFKKTGNRGFVVWDPITDVWTDLPPPTICFRYEYDSYSAVVLCGVAGCDHHNCHSGRFLVVLICRKATFGLFVHAYVYSSEDGAWGQRVFDGTWSGSFVVKQPAVIGDGIYSIVGGGNKILKYDLVEHRFSWIDMPHRKYKKDPVLLQNQDGSLGLTCLRSSSTLYLWSRTLGAEGEVGGWVQQMSIKLRKVLPVHDERRIKANVIGFADGVGVFFITTNVGVFTIDLNSWKVMKVCKPSNNFRTAFPLISTFTPDRA